MLQLRPFDPVHDVKLQQHRVKVLSGKGANLNEQSIGKVLHANVRFLSILMIVVTF